MFTGLIEAVEPVLSITPQPSGKRFAIGLQALGENFRPGESICVNGVCLTLSRLEQQTGHFDVIPETLGLTNLANCQPGDRVNLERAMPADGRFGGHLVQGHTDGVGNVLAVENSSAEYALWIGAEAALMRLMMFKGSVAIDGVSMTIARVESERFKVCVIPTTLEKTNFSDRAVGDWVNLEGDVIGKWINQRLDAILPPQGAGGLTRKKLQEGGFN